ncbi:MAG: hypothetical protein QM610_11320 [Chitinophagaceae bacterium]
MPVTKLRKIGNSMGVIIPKIFLDAFQSENVDLKMVNGQLIVTPVVEENPRAGWVEMFEKAKRKGELDNQEILIEDTIDDFKEWTW